MADTSPSSEYFLSASQETSSRSRLFRPKELRDFVFPGVGMIMHSLFWVKHSLYLSQLGADPLHQPRLLLYATQDDDPLYDEGLLWYCLASRVDPDATVTLTAGIKVVKNWLFEPQYDYDGDIYDRVAEELQSITAAGTAYDCDRFVEEVFAQWFVTRCRERDIALAERLQSDVAAVAQATAAEDRQTQRTITAFCELLGDLTRTHEGLLSQGNLTVIGSTIRFATQLLVPANEDVIDTLAETSMRITPQQTTALLRAIAAIDHGRHFIRSALFIIYIDPTKHSGSEFTQEMRRIHDIVTSDANAVVEMAGQLVDIGDLPRDVMQDLDKTSYFWLLNFFMADGETISRTLLDTTDQVITRGDVQAYFEENRERATHFHGFVSRAEDGQEYLPRLLTELSVDESPRVYRFLSQLHDNIEAGDPPAAVLLDLLATNGAIEEETADTYRILEYPSNTNQASFYGIGPLRNWTQTMLASYE